MTEPSKDTNNITSDVPPGLSEKPLAQRLQEAQDTVKAEELYILSQEAQTIAKDPNLISILILDMDMRIKKDRPVKLSVFFTALSAYLKNPMNLFQKGESGVGKSYNTVQSLTYFPCDTVILLGGISPKALIHDHGILMTKEGKPIDEDNIPERPQRIDFTSHEDFKDALAGYKKALKEYKKALKESYTLIELSGKVLVFLETPEFEAFRMLYPILSHDTERYEYRFVDKSGKGKMRTVHVVIEGWPATIFLMVERKFMEELATRSFTVTPENSPEKIEAANELTNQKVCYPWEQQKENKTVESIKEILRAIQSWFKVYDADVTVPFTELSKLFPREITRDMRDFAHFTQFVKTLTAFHLFQRPVLKLKNQRFLVATLYDVAAALSIYAEIFESTRTGTDQALLNFYHAVICKKDQWTIKEATSAYNQNTTKKASSDTVRLKLERLAQIGYVDIQKSDTDKRMNIYTPLLEENQEKPEISREINIRSLLEPKLKNGFETWLKNILVYPDLEIKKNYFGTETPLTKEELCAMIWQCENIDSLQADFLVQFLNRETRLKPKKELKTERTLEIRQYSENSLTSYTVAPYTNNEAITTVEEKTKTGANDEKTEKQTANLTEPKKVVTIKQIKTGHPCYIECGLAAEWELQDPDIEKPYLFCNKCFQSTRKGYESNGYKIELATPTANTQNNPDKKDASEQRHCKNCDRDQTEYCNSCYDFDNYKNNQSKLDQATQPTEDA